MYNLGNVERWMKLAPKSIMNLPDAHPRRIRLNVNAANETKLYRTIDGGELVFLAVVKGLEVVEFNTSGKVGIVADSDDLFIYTAELEPTFVEIPDAESYTEIVQRKERNPDLEYITYQMNLNAERRMQALEVEYAQRLERMEQNVQRSTDALNKITTSGGDGKPIQPKTDDTSGGADGGTADDGTGAEGV